MHILTRGKPATALCCAAFVSDTPGILGEVRERSAAKQPTPQGAQAIGRMQQSKSSFPVAHHRRASKARPFPSDCVAWGGACHGPYIRSCSALCPVHGAAGVSSEGIANVILTSYAWLALLCHVEDRFLSGVHCRSSHWALGDGRSFMSSVLSSSTAC